MSCIRQSDSRQIPRIASGRVQTPCPVWASTQPKPHGVGPAYASLTEKAARITAPEPVRALIQLRYHGVGPEKTLFTENAEGPRERARNSARTGEGVNPTQVSRRRPGKGIIYLKAEGPKGYTDHFDFVKPLTDNFYRITVARKNPRVAAPKNAVLYYFLRNGSVHCSRRLENNSQTDTPISFSYRTNQRKSFVLFPKSTSYTSNFLCKSRLFQTRKRTMNRRFDGSFGNETIYSGEYIKLPKELKVR